ncbi:hypothetical protein D3C75_355450 [compost metagenome]
MLTGKLAIHFRLLQFQFGDAGIKRHDLIENGFGFQADIDGFTTNLILVQGVFGFFQILTDLRQLIFQKLQALSGFGRSPLDILPYVELGDFIEDLNGFSRFLAFKSKPDHAGFFTTLRYIKYLLVLQNTGKALVTHNAERCTRISLQHFDLQFNAVLVIGLARLAFDQDIVVFIQQSEVATFTADES